MQKRLSITILTILLACGLVVQAQAQSLPKDKQAEFVFDVRLDKLRESPLAQSIQQQVESMPGMSDDLDITKVARLFGAMSLPDSVADFEAMETDNELRMEFFARIQFVDEASADEVMGKISDDGESFEKDGTTFYRPNPEDNAPKNMIAYRKDPKTIEVCTDLYQSQGTGKGVFSGGLEAAWNKVPDHAIRLAIDLDNASALIDEAIAQAKEEMQDPTMGGFLNLVKKAKNVRLSFDLGGDELLRLSATGVDDDQAEELRKGLDAMMGFAKMGAQQMMPMIEMQDEAAAKVAGEIVNSLAATRDGSDVNIVIAKPAGFESAIQSLIEKSMPGGGDF